MKLRKLVAIGLIGSLCLTINGGVRAGNQEVKRYIMAVSNNDSTAQNSEWIPVEGATSVRLRMWTTHLAPGINADTTTSDSLVDFTVYVGDSIGGHKTNPFTGFQVPYPADSFLIPQTAVGDTSVHMIRAYPYPTVKPLRSAQTGTGRWVQIVPVIGGAAVSNDIGPTYLNTKFLRVSYTPFRRNTAGGALSTQGKRVVGLRNFVILGEVMYGNK